MTQNPTHTALELGNTGQRPTAHGPTGQAPIAHCDTMADVREHIDALDSRIVALIAERGGYVAQAGRIKSSLDQVVDQPRIESIITRVRAMAHAQGAPEAVMEATYRAMIAAFIEFERGEFVRLHEGAPK